MKTNMKTEVIMKTKEGVRNIKRRVQSFLDNQATFVLLGKRKKFPWINNQLIDK